MNAHPTDTSASLYEDALTRKKIENEPQRRASALGGSADLKQLACKEREEKKYRENLAQLYKELVLFR